MSRIEELTFKWLDDELTDEEAAELEQLLASGPAARAEYASCCDVEASLRSRAEDFDVSARTMARIRCLAPRPVAPAAPVPVQPAQPRRRRTAVWLRLAASLAVLGVVGALLLKRLRPDPQSNPSGIVSAAISQVEAEVVVSREGRDIQPRPGFILLDGDTIQVAPSALAVVTYTDGSRLVLSADTQATLHTGTGTDASGSKLVELARGNMTAHVRKQPAGCPVIVHTPTANVTVHGTRFSLLAESRSTRLDVVEGSVGLERTSDGAAVQVAKSEYAVALPEGDLMATALPPRISDGLVALYGFREGTGNMVHDVSAVGQPLDLHIKQPDATAWLPEGGLLLKAPAAFVSSTASGQKIVDACRTTNEVTIEAWITPSTVDQIGPARIVTLSSNTSERNLTLGMDGRYDGWPPKGGTRFITRLRTTETGANGMPRLHTATGSVVADLTHLVFTRTSKGTTRMFIDGDPRAKGEIGGDFSGWNPDFRLALGDEFTHDRPWVGTFHLLAVYGRALTAAEVRTNFRRGKDMDPPR
jgi:ferric-dicitrate binding protein FerR (iron transport regulator)